MKPFLCLVLTLVPVFAIGEDSHSPPLVTTSGTAEIRVVPDLAELYFRVYIRDPDLENGLQRHAKRAEKVLKILRTEGVLEADIQSEPVVLRRLDGDHYDYATGGGFFSVGIDDDSDTDKASNDDDSIVYGKRDFAIIQDIKCNLRDIKRITEITSTVMAAGAFTTRDSNLRTSELRKYRDEARIKAVRIAKEKATALANELGAKVGKPHSIIEGAGPGWWEQNNTNGVQGGRVDQLPPTDNESQSQFAPGTISVTATVQVSFVLE